MIKKDLEKRYKEMKELNQTKYYEIDRLEKEIQDLKRTQDSLEFNKRNLVAAANARADLIKQILNIILGEAQPICKYEVIRDFFLEQIKERDSLNKNKFNNGYYDNNKTYLSDRMNEEGLNE